MKYKLLLTIILILGLSIASYTAVKYVLGTGDEIDFTAVTKTNDGSGSGLDADKLDGKEGSEYESSLTKGNLTATSPIALDQTRQVIGGAAVVSVASGYTIPTTTEKGNYDTVVTNDPSDYDEIGDLPAGVTLDTEWDNISEIETATSVNIILNTEINTEAKLEAIMAGLNIYTTNDGSLADDDVSLDDVQTACSSDFHNIGGTDATDDTVSGTELDSLLFDSNGLLKRTSENNFGVVSDNSSNWDTAYTNRIDTWSAPLLASVNTASLQYDGVTLDVNVSDELYVATVSGVTGANEDDLTDNNLTDLQDVGISSPASGEVLTYSGSAWANAAIPSDITRDEEWNTEGEVETIWACYNIYTSDDASCANWDTAYGWGNHSGQGYLTSESDPNVDTEAEIEAITGAYFGTSKAVTTGHIWVADGTDFESVVMSGDIAIIADGTTTIQANAVDSADYTDASIDHEHLAPDIITGLSEVTSADLDMMIIADQSDSWALKKVDMAEVRGGAGASEWTDQGTYLEPTDADESVRSKKNLMVKSTSVGTSGDGVVSIAVGTAPTSSPANMTQLYSDDISTEVDYMEYSSDALAQAAYVNSETFTSDLCTGGTAIESGHYSTYVPANLFDDDTGTQWISDLIGSANDNVTYIGYDFGAGNDKHIRRFKIKQTASQEASEVKVRYSDDNSSWTVLQTVALTQDSDWHTHDLSSSATHRYWSLLCTSAKASVYWQVAEIEMMGISLQCYSESTIKEQGSYSLKSIARATDSLNDTLTRTVSPTIDLSGYSTIKLDIRASRTGSNIKVGIHDSGGTTTEHTANVASADTWQTETWDISGVSDANKDAIDSIIVTVVNADATNTFYLDNAYTDAMAELRVRDEMGNVTTLSPHSFVLFKPDDSQTFPFSYYSENKYIGKRINVDMYGMIKALEKLTGKKFIYEEDIEVQELEKGKVLPEWLEKRRHEKPHK